MAEMMQFDLVSPERKLASAQVRSVQIPGAEGDLTAMPQHAPTITTLRPGNTAQTAASATRNPSDTASIPAPSNRPRPVGVARNHRP
jgi:F0F1-type ATP synthase epsilon subunit